MRKVSRGAKTSSELNECSEQTPSAHLANIMYSSMKSSLPAEIRGDTGTPSAEILLLSCH